MTEATTETTTAPAEGAPAAPSATETEPSTFPLEYVQRLRGESAEHRKGAARADTLARQAVAAIAARDGRLHDARDLSFDDEWLGDGGLDESKITAAIGNLIADRPHLARPPRPQGDIGQGARPETAAPVGLGALLKAGA